MIRPCRRALFVALGAALIALFPTLVPRAAALEAVVFLSDARPSVWGTGIGGTLTTTWFKLLALEGEIARQPGEPIDSSMTSFQASALLAPPLGPLTSCRSRRPHRSGNFRSSSRSPSRAQSATSRS